MFLTVQTLVQIFLKGNQLGGTRGKIIEARAHFMQREARNAHGLSGSGP